MPSSRVDLEVLFLNNSRIFVAKVVIPHDCIDKNPLNKYDIGIVIFEALVHAEVNSTHRVLLLTWPLWNVMQEDIRMHKHKLHHIQIQKKLQGNMWPYKNLQKYESMECILCSANEYTRQKFLIEKFIMWMKSTFKKCGLEISCR